MRLNLGVDEALSTTRTVRRRLDVTRPVERDVLLECIELAVQAPSGTNRQGWHWIVVDDRTKIQAIAQIYRTALEPAFSALSPELVAAMRGARKRMYESGRHLYDHMHEVPILVVPCQSGRPPKDLTTQAGFWGSILPAIWSFMLAARERGLGTAWTTAHLDHEEEVAALLGISQASYTQAGLFPVAYTVGTGFKSAPRASADEVTHWNQW